VGESNSSLTNLIEKEANCCQSTFYQEEFDWNWRILETEANSGTRGFHVRFRRSLKRTATQTIPSSTTSARGPRFRPHERNPRHLDSKHRRQQSRPRTLVAVLLRLVVVQCTGISFRAPLSLPSLVVIL